MSVMAVNLVRSVAGDWVESCRSTRRTTSCPRPPRRGADRARRRPASRRRARGRPPARAGRSRHRQDDHPGRGDRRPHRAPRRPTRRSAGADLLAQGRRAPPRPRHRAASGARCSADLLDLPLVRLRPDPAYAPRELYDEPLRLLCAPEQDVVLQQLLTREAESVVWPEAIFGALGTRGFASEVPGALARPEKGLGATPSRARRREGLPEYVAAAAFMEQYDVVLGRPVLPRLRHLIATAVRMLQDPEQPVATSSAGATPTSSSTSTRTPTLPRSPCCAPSPATRAGPGAPTGARRRR